MTIRVAQIESALFDIEKRISEAAGMAGRTREEITLIVVTKTYPSTDVAILRQLGARNFGENRDREGSEKASQNPGIWHFQGQMQSNKISSISRWANVIHSIDNPRHLIKLNDSLPAGASISIFLQVSLAPDVGRGGVAPQELDLLAKLALQLPNIKLLGLMAVAPLGEEPDSAFSRLAQIRSDFRYKFPEAPYLSAGMSGDFESAIRHGATHLRIGSSILGERSRHG